MKIQIIVITAIILLSANSKTIAGGKVYWQNNGVLITGSNLGAFCGLVPDMHGGAYVVVCGDQCIYAAKVDKHGNLPWGLNGVLADTNINNCLTSGGGGVSDGHNGVIVISQWLDSWGYNLTYQRIDSMGNKVWGLHRKG